jgi:putative holliday junction resolvase
MSITPDYALALDVGSKRIGVALASLSFKLPRPLTTLANDDRFFDTLNGIIKTEAIGVLVVGLPRGLQGQETGQTKYVRDFVDQLKAHTDLAVHYQDEALSSTRAEAELTARGKIYQKGDIDALAATYILEDYLIQPKETN